MKDSNWDIDLRDGLAGESKLADLLSLDTVEVKTDRRWHETGNLYIETECWTQTTKTWEPSGLSVSIATHWAFSLEDAMLIVPTFRLRECVYGFGRPIHCNISPNPSKGYLIGTNMLLEHIASARATEEKAYDAYEGFK